MSSPESNPLAKLTALADQAETALKEAAASGSFEESDQALDELEAQLKQAERALNPFEAQMNLTEQYENQIKLLDSVGIPEEINGIPQPTLNQVRDRLLAKQELCEKKMEQGFNKLLIVPFGMSIADLSKIYGDRLKAHYADKEAPDPNDPTKKIRVPDPATTKLFAEADPAKPLELDTNQPVYVWEGYQNQEIKYFPDQFDKDNPGGFSKDEVIAEGGPWQIVLIEDIPIPRAGQGQELGGRHQLEAGISPRDYLAKLKTPEYEGEEGLTPELWLMKAITRLEEQNQVTDDFQGKGSLSYNLGAYFPNSARVASAYWLRDFRHAFMDRVDADVVRAHYGASSAVRV